MTNSSINESSIEVIKRKTYELFPRSRDPLKNKIPVYVIYDPSNGEIIDASLEKTIFDEDNSGGYMHHATLETFVLDHGYSSLGLQPVRTDPRSPTSPTLTGLTGVINHYNDLIIQRENDRIRAEQEAAQRQELLKKKQLNAAPKKSKKSLFDLLSL